MNQVPRLYGVPRSGGTLIYNVMSHIFDGNIIPQAHSYFQPDTDEPVIITYRDFRDSCLSYWRACVLDARGKGFDSLEHKQLIGLYELIKCAFVHKKKVVHLNRFRKAAKRPGSRYLFLRYEDFFDSEKGDVNFNFIFDQIETFLDIKVPPHKKMEIADKYCFSSQKEESKKYENFHGDGSANSGWDEKRHIHGHHLFTGKPGSWRLLVPDRYHSILTIILRRELRLWGYE